MKLTRLRITIEPWVISDSRKELRVEAIVDGVSHVVAVPFEDNDFQSRFEYLMEHAMREIKMMVKAREQ